MIGCVVVSECRSGSMLNPEFSQAVAPQHGFHTLVSMVRQTQIYQGRRTPTRLANQLTRGEFWAHIVCGRTFSCALGAPWQEVPVLDYL